MVSYVVFRMAALAPIGWLIGVFRTLVRNRTVGLDVATLLLICRIDRLRLG